GVPGRPDGAGAAGLSCLLGGAGGPDRMYRMIRRGHWPLPQETPMIRGFSRPPARAGDDELVVADHDPPACRVVMPWKIVCLPGWSPMFRSRLRIDGLSGVAASIPQVPANADQQQRQN